MRGMRKFDSVTDYLKAVPPAPRAQNEARR